MQDCIADRWLVCFPAVICSNIGNRIWRIYLLLAMNYGRARSLPKYSRYLSSYLSPIPCCYQRISSIRSYPWSFFSPSHYVLVDIGSRYSSQSRDLFIIWRFQTREFNEGNSNCPAKQNKYLYLYPYPYRIIFLTYILILICFLQYLHMSLAMLPH